MADHAKYEENSPQVRNGLLGGLRYCQEVARTYLAQPAVIQSSLSYLFYVFTNL